MDSKIYFKEFEAIFTLRHLLKEEYKDKCLDNLEYYYIPIEFVLKVGRELSPKIRRVDCVSTRNQMRPTPVFIMV